MKMRLSEIKGQFDCKTSYNSGAIEIYSKTDGSLVGFITAAQLSIVQGDPDPMVDIGGPDYFIAPQKFCGCACHDPKWVRGLEHETKCCDKMVGWMQDDLLVKAINEGRLKIEPNEVIIIRSDDHAAARWAGIAQVITHHFPDALVLCLPRGTTLESISKQDAKKILKRLE